MDTQEKTRFDIAQQYVAILLRLLIVIGIGLEIAEGFWGNTAVARGILFLTFLPAILARRLNIHVPPEFDVATIVFIFASLFLGEMRDYYNDVWWWDIVLHTTSGGLFVSVAGYRYIVHGNELIIDRGIRRFIERNPRLFSRGKAERRQRPSSERFRPVVTNIDALG